MLVEDMVDLSDARRELRKWATRIGSRYMGEERAEEYGARNGVRGELVARLRPERIVSAMDLAD